MLQLSSIKYWWLQAIAFFCQILGIFLISRLTPRPAPGLM